jgi:hypothetical protein
MKLATLAGVALIVLGVLALAYQGITYTTREKVIDPGLHGPAATSASAPREARVA